MAKAKEDVFRFAQWEKQPGLVHGCSSGYLGDMQQKKNKEYFCQNLGIAETCLVAAEQVHGHEVAKVSSEDRGTVIGGVDGLITNAKNVYLTIRVADCVPVFCYDPLHQVVGLFHAGWRGIVSGIVEQTIASMQTAFGCQPADIQVGLGPSIQACCFVVGEEVASHFVAFGSQAASQQDGQWQVDLQQSIVIKFERLGIQPAQIERINVCTACSEGGFFSYRRDSSQSGRMLGIIGLAS